MPVSSCNANLPALARAAIAQALGITQATDFPVDNRWHDLGASFVTLNKNDRLRGCIGSLQAWRSLLEDVQNNAIAAALHDPRFPAVTRNELASITVEVSVLSTPEPLPAMDHSHLVATLRPNVDGVIVSNDIGQRATFLPQVWEQLPDIEMFLQQLKSKAGLAVDRDDSQLHYAIYQVEKITETA